MFRRKRVLRNWQVYTDGAIRPEAGLSGLSAVVYDERGTIALWWYQAAERLTCNEAEYRAAIFALGQLLPFRPLSLSILSDSQVMVRQMRGEAAVRSPALRLLHQTLRGLVAQFEAVTFCHISREQNRVADALAYEAIAREMAAHAQMAKGGKELQCAKKQDTAVSVSGR